MANVTGYLNGEEVYNKDCLQSEVDLHIRAALNLWGSIDDLGNIEVEVTDDDDHCWVPV